jgi:UDP-glucose 4-epimerase
MATLVTGGTGFVGSNIVRTLAQQGHDVVCFDLVGADALARKYIGPWSERVTFIQGDMLNKADLERAAAGRGITKIVHAAVYTGIRSDIERDRSRAIVDVNVSGTANLLDLACGLSLERFLYVSSGAVYGEGREDQALAEDAALYPRSLYASTKYASELLTRRYGELHGFPTVSVRLSSPYGPMERVTGHRAVMSALYEWTGNVVRGEPVLVGDRSVGRDYTYVADTAAGIRAVLDAPSPSYDVYNVSAGPWVTLGDVIDSLLELRPSLRVVDDPTKEFEILRPGSARGVLDVTRLRDDLGFAPGFDLTAGIGDYLSWRENAPFKD